MQFFTYPLCFDLSYPWRQQIQEEKTMLLKFWEHKTWKPTLARGLQQISIHTPLAVVLCPNT